MVNHVVMWTFRQDVPEAERRRVAAGMAAGMASLGKRVPGICSLRVVAEPLGTSNCDILLVSSFDSEKTLADYQRDPEHIALKEKYMPAFASRSCMDYR